MPFKEAETYRFNPFDLTKVWPHSDYPLHEVGRLTLNRNPGDFHAEIEQAAFEPNNLVPGIGPSPDKMLLARLISYADAHRARLGVNYKQIPVNRPKSPVHSYGKGGTMRMRTSPIRSMRPTQRAAPRPTPSGIRGGHLECRRRVHPRRLHQAQGRRRFRTARYPGAQGHGRRPARPAGVHVVGQLKNGVSDPVLERAFEYWRNIDKAIGDRIAKSVKGG